MFKVSEIMKKDLIMGRATYVRKGMLYFDSIQVSEIGIKLFNKNKLVAEKNLEQKVIFKEGYTVTFKIIEGKMKIELI